MGLLFSIYLILTRQLAQHEEPVAMQAYTATGLRLGAILMVLDPLGSRPCPGLRLAHALMLLGGMGLIATFNHLLLVQAFGVRRRRCWRRSSIWRLSACCWVG